MGRARASRRRATRKVVATVAAQEDVSVDVPLTSEEDLLTAVASLYDDRLRPFGRLVRKRLGELATFRGQVLIDGDLGRLRKTCEECPSLTVQRGEGSEWSVLLLQREQNFIDVYSLIDCYPSSLWEELRHYLQELDNRGGSLPGGRYSCAKALLESALPSFQTRSLGEVCHIVQLAMSEKKLLGYLDGTIAPYERSNSMLKDTAAELCLGSCSSQQIPLASWESARSCMVDVLESAVRKGKKQVPISTLKRLFRSRFHMELSETALGYTKLSDLLQDAMFGDICSVRLLERGYVVLPSEIFSRCSLKELKQLPRHHTEPQNNTLKVGTPTSIVRNTFIQMNLECKGAKRSQSVPKHIGSQFFEVDSDSTDAVGFFDDQSTEVGSGSVSPTLTASPLWTPRLLEEPESGYLSSWYLEDSCPDHNLCPDQFSTCGLDLRMDFDAAVCLPTATVCAHSFCHFTFPSNTWMSNQACPPPAWTPSVESVCTLSEDEPQYLSKKACDGSVVRNTFIELATHPVSPHPRYRSHSLPRNHGSVKSPRDDTFLTKSIRDSSINDRTSSKTGGDLVLEPAKCVLRLSHFL